METEVRTPDAEIILPGGDPREAPPAESMLPARRLPSTINAGTVEIESQRAVAEALGKLKGAREYRRSLKVVEADIKFACAKRSLADAAFYTYGRGGAAVTGPSIRLAEELARCWGNIEYGIRELSRQGDRSEMEAYCWDLETNTISSQKFSVRHFRDTSSGGKVLTTERDIYEVTANMGGRRLRARILAVLPKWYSDLAVEECRRTLSGENKATDEKVVPLADRIKNMAARFAKYGVKPEDIEARAGKKMAALTSEDLIELQGVFNSLREGNSTKEELFAPAGQTDGHASTGGAAAAIAERAAAGAKTDPESTAKTGAAPAQAATASAPKASQPAKPTASAQRPAQAQPQPPKAQAPASQQQPPAAEEPPPAGEQDMF